MVEPEQLAVVEPVLLPGGRRVSQPTLRLCLHQVLPPVRAPARRSTFALITAIVWPSSPRAVPRVVVGTWAIGAEPELGQRPPGAHDSPSTSDPRAGERPLRNVANRAITAGDMNVRDTVRCFGKT